MGSAGESQEEISRVLVIGSNLIATQIIEELIAAKLTLHQATTSSASEGTTDNATVHKSDLSSDSLRSIIAAVKPDLIISTHAASSFEFQKLVINLAVDAGVPRFVAGEFGLGSLNERTWDRLSAAKEKARTIRYLQQLATERRISYVGVAVGYTLDHGLNNGSLLGFDLKWQSATMHGSGDERFPASSLAWIGRVTVSVIENWDEVKDQYLYAAGMVTTANELLHCIEHVTGQKWEVGRTDVEDCVREADRRIERGFLDAGMWLKERSVMYDESLGAARPFIEHDAKGKLGLQDEDLEQVVHRVLHHSHAVGKGGCGCD